MMMMMREMLSFNLRLMQKLKEKKKRRESYSRRLDNKIIGAAPKQHSISGTCKI